MNPDDAKNIETLRRSIRESDVVSVIRDYLVLHGALVIRVNSGAVKDDGRYVAFNRWHAPGHRDEQAGVADLLVLWDGHAFAIECKRPVGGRQSDAQRAFQAAWERAGGWYILARDLDQVIAELGDL